MRRHSWLTTKKLCGNRLLLPFPFSEAFQTFSPTTPHDLYLTPASSWKLRGILYTSRYASAPLSLTRQSTRHAAAVHRHNSRYYVSLATVVTPPAVFVSLLLALWFYKCCMMVIFQNKIIYMPSVPPFSRQEQLSTYARSVKPVVWRQQQIESKDGTPLALAIGELDCSRLATVTAEKQALVNHIFVIYFQGNGSSTPPRLPLLSDAIKTICSETNSERIVLIVPSYRGYWKSKGCASQPGIEKDAAAAIAWAQSFRQDVSGLSKLVIWGQSLGAGVATQAVANALRESKSVDLDGLILETPFTSIKEMLVALYPQKWLPYRYLWPFLRSWWDSVAALRLIKQLNGPRDLLILTAAKDEVAPPEMGHKLFNLASELGFNASHKTIKGAYHHEATIKREGRVAVADFISSLAVKEIKQATDEKMGVHKLSK